MIIRVGYPVRSARSRLAALALQLLPPGGVMALCLRDGQLVLDDRLGPGYLIVVTGRTTLETILEVLPRVGFAQEPAPPLGPPPARFKLGKLGPSPAPAYP